MTIKRYFYLVNCNKYSFVFFFGIPSIDGNFAPTSSPSSYSNHQTDLATIIFVSLVRTMFFCKLVVGPRNNSYHHLT